MRTLLIAAAAGPALIIFANLNSAAEAIAAASSSSSSTSSSSTAAAFVVLPSKSGRRRPPSHHRQLPSSSSFLLPPPSSRSYPAAVALRAGLTPRDNERTGDGVPDVEEDGPIGGEEESSVAPRLEDARAASSHDAMPPPWTPTSSTSPEKDSSSLPAASDADDPQGRSVVVPPPTVGPPPDVLVPEYGGEEEAWGQVEEEEEEDDDEWREFRDADRDWDNEYYAEDDWGAIDEEAGSRRGGLLPPKKKTPFLQPDEPVGRSVVLPTIEPDPVRLPQPREALGFGVTASPPRKAGKRRRGGGLLPPKEPIPGLHADEPIGSIVMPVIGPPDVLNEEEEEEGEEGAGFSSAETERKHRRRPFFAEEAGREKLPTKAIMGEDEVSAARNAMTNRPDSRGFAPPKTPPENPKQERGKLLPPKESIPGLHADEPIGSVTMPVIGPPDVLNEEEEDDIAGGREGEVPASSATTGDDRADARGFTPPKTPPERPKRERGKLLPPQPKIEGLHADEPVESIVMPVIGPPDELKVSDEDYEEMLADIKDDGDIGPGGVKVDSRGFTPPSNLPERPKRERGKLLPPRESIPGLHADEPIGSVNMPVIGPPDRLMSEEEKDAAAPNVDEGKEEEGSADDVEAKVDTRGFTPSPPAETPKRERGKLLPPKEPIPGLDHDEPIGGSVVLPVIGPPDTLITKAKEREEEEEEEGVFADGADVRGFTADVKTIANARGFGIPRRPPPKPRPRPQTDALKRNIENILIDSDAETIAADARHLAPVRPPNAAGKRGRGKLLPPKEKVPGLDVDEPIGGSVVLPVIGPPDRLKEDEDVEEEVEEEGADYYRGEVDEAMAHLFDEENGGGGGYYEAAGTSAAEAAVAGGAAGGFSSSTAFPPPPAIPVARGDDGAASGEKSRTVTDAELRFLHERIQELEDQVRTYQEFIADNLVTTRRERVEAAREAEERIRSTYEKKIAELLEDESEGNSE